MALTGEAVEGSALAPMTFAAPIALTAGETLTDKPTDDTGDPLIILFRVGVGKMSVTTESTLTEADKAAAEEKPNAAATLLETPENMVPEEAAVEMIEPIAALISVLANEVNGRPAVAATFVESEAEAWSIEKTILVPMAAAARRCSSLVIRDRCREPFSGSTAVVPSAAAAARRCSLAISERRRKPFSGSTISLAELTAAAAARRRSFVIPDRRREPFAGSTYARMTADGSMPSRAAMAAASAAFASADIVDVSSLLLSSTAITKTGDNTATAVGDGDDDCVCEGVAEDEVDNVEVDEALAPRVNDDVGVFDEDDDKEFVVLGVTGGVGVDVEERVPDGVAVADTDKDALLESEMVGVCDTLAPPEREEVGDIVAVVDLVIVDEDVFVGVDVLLCVFVPVGDPVCEKEAVGVVESETDGVCDALAAIERDAVGEAVAVVDSDKVADGVSDGVSVLEGVLVLVGVSV